MPLPSEEVTPPVTKTNLGTAVDLRGFSNSSAERTEKRAIGPLFHRKRKAVQHHQARALGSATGRIRRNVHVLVGSRVLEPPVETQSAEARVAQLTVADAAVLDDGDEPRAEEPKPGPQPDRSGEGRPLDREVSRRFVEPGPEIRGDVRVARERHRAIVPEPPGEEVVARASARIADDDLAVQEGSIRDAHVPKLGDRREEIAAGAIDQAQARAITRKERPDAVPLQLEEVVRRVEGTPGEPRTHRHDGTREPALRVLDVDERRMLRAVRRTALTRHQPRIGRGSPG